MAKCTKKKDHPSAVSLSLRVNQEGEELEKVKQILSPPLLRDLDGKPS